MKRCALAVLMCLALPLLSPGRASRSRDSVCKQLSQFGWVHGISCPSENTLFVAELLNWRIQKLILRRAQK